MHWNEKRFLVLIIRHSLFFPITTYIITPYIIRIQMGKTGRKGMTNDGKKVTGDYKPNVKRWGKIVIDGEWNTFITNITSAEQQFKTFVAKKNRTIKVRPRQKFKLFTQSNISKWLITQLIRPEILWISRKNLKMYPKSPFTTSNLIKMVMTKANAAQNQTSRNKRYFQGDYYFFAQSLKNWPSPFTSLYLIICSNHFEPETHSLIFWMCSRFFLFR